MSVATRNPFAVLDEDSSPSAPPPPPPEPTSPAPAQSQPTRGRGRGGPASRGGRYYQRGGAAPAPATPPTDDQPPAESKPPRRFDGERKEGRDGRGRGRGGRGGDRGGRGRPFDKHSQTGKTDSDKKVHNSWGGDDGETERKTEEAATNDAAAENANASSGALNDWATPAADAPADDWAVPAADAPTDGSPAADGAEKPQSGERRERRGDREEEEDNTLTLDQYLAQQREKENALVPKLEVRKPNDGADDDVFQGAAPIQKKEDLEYFAAKTKSAPKARAKKDEKVFIEIEARFERPNRGGRGGARGGDRGGDRGRGERRGRGGGRGRGGANGYSGAPPRGSAAVNVDDETAFPSLS